MIQNPVCLNCRREAEAGVAAEAMGRHENVRTRITGLPVLRCSHCGLQTPPYFGFPEDAARMLVLVCELPVAGKTGLFVKTPACAKCRSQLHGAETEPVSFSTELDLAGATFQVDLSVLSTICPSCEVHQFQGSEPLEAEIAAALRRAFVYQPLEQPA